MIRQLKKLLWRFERDEGASALTEFTLFLPAWVIAFAGIVNLGKIGHGTVNTQIQAQMDLWDKVLVLTDYDLQDVEHISPRAAAIPAATKSSKPRAKFVGTNTTANTFEATTWSVAMGAQGHWGEAYQRTIILDSAGISDLGNGPHLKPDDLLGDVPFPKLLVSDALTDSGLPSGGVASIIASAIQASGGLAAVSAGIRYGVIVGEKTNDDIEVTGFGTVSSNSRYDILVPPAAMTGFTADRVPFFMARLMAESEDTYADALDYTDAEWSNASPGNFDFDTDVGKDEAQDDIERQCRRDGFGSNTSRCQSCRQRGFNTKSACDCADDPDCPAPPP